MAYEPLVETLDGVTTDFDVPFSYIAASHVKATVAGNAATFSWLSPSRIRLSSPGTAGQTLVVYRQTPIDSALVTFQATQAPYAAALNAAISQVLLKLQEEQEADALAAQYAEEAAAAQVAAETARNAAQTAETNAETAETNAETAETNAEAAAAAAATSATNANNSANAAATSATNAGNSANAAATSATNAGNSANAAATSATNANNSANAAATSASLAAAVPSFKNRLINGCFRSHQRQLTTPIADDTYCFDRWYVLTQSAAVTPLHLTAPENGQINGGRFTQSDTTAQRFGQAQIIEMRNMRDLRGSAVTLSGRVRTSTSTLVRYAILEWTGTADAVISDVVNDWTGGIAVGQFFNSTSLVLVASGIRPTIANEYTDLTAITGTVSAAANNLIVMVWTANAEAQNVTLDMGLMQLEKGSVATAFENIPQGLNLLLCQRFFERSYDGAAGAAGAVTQAGCESATSRGVDTILRIPVGYRATKRVAGTVALFSTTGAQGFIHGVIGAVDLAASVATAGQKGFTAFPTSATQTGQVYIFQWTCDAEL